MNFKLATLGWAAGLLSSLAAAAATFTQNPYGTASHLFGWEFDKAEVEFKMMRSEGIGTLRGPFNWDALQAPSGDWDFKELDAVMNYANASGVQFFPIFGAPLQKFTPLIDHMPEFLTYVRTIVNRYGDQVPGFEVLNEPEIKAQDYAKILRETAAEVRKLKPNLKLSFAGTSGIPLDYIEDAFKAGAADAMDIMSVHPYGWNDVPESRLEASLRELRELMKRYGAGHKPIWITEIGYSSEPRTNFLDLVLPELFKEMGLAPETTTALVFYDPAYRFYTETHTFQIKDHLPKLRAIRKITLAQLKHLPVKAGELLVLPDIQAYPGEYVPALRNYLQRGGKVLSPAGLPFYFDLQLQPGGELRCTQVNAKYAKELRFGWEAAWTKKDVPPRNTGWAWAEGKGSGREIPQYHSTYYFFNGDNIAPGDRWVPVIYGTEGNYRGASAGVYHFNSDLKGKLAVSGLSWRGCTEEDQARLLPRTYLIALAAGAEKICWHNYRATETKIAEIEAYFGLHHRNLEPKAASTAYVTLIRQAPPGSTGFKLTRRGDLYQCEWVRPDGRKTFAVWRGSIVTASVEFQVRGGTAPTVTDYLGAPVKVNPGTGGKLTLNVGPGIQYINGVGELR